jgi:solute carrier family 1 (neuronal/epithelial high affinity glutamate transporter), member 1
MRGDERGERRAPAWLLPVLLLAGAAAGATIGGTLGHRWTEPSMEGVVLVLRLAGTVFMALLKALIIPLLVVSIVSGVGRMGDLRKVGRLAGATGVYFLATSLLAVLTGLALVNLIGPGIGASAEGAADAERITSVARSASQAIYDVIASMFPPNIAEAAVQGNFLGIIVLSLLFGVAVALEGERAHRLLEVMDVINNALFRLVRFVIWLAPVGIMGLVADRIGRAGGGDVVWNELQRLLFYALTVLAGLAFHALVTLPLLLRFAGRRSPIRYAAGLSDALLTAFGTASSAATMPVTLNRLIQRNGVSARAADLVVPLGTTINMDGTALYEAVAAVFIAQTLGYELSFAQQLTVVLTATLASIGAAAIPEAGLVTMVIVVTAIGLPAESVGLIISIDWILDRFRTAVNVWGDSVGAGVIDRFARREDPAPPG